MTATEEALLQAQNAAIALTHQDTQRRAEYEDLKRTMHKDNDKRGCLRAPVTGG